MTINFFFKTQMIWLIARHAYYKGEGGGGNVKHGVMHEKLLCIPGVP